MRKLKLFFACLLMAFLSIGQMWAVEELKATIDFSSNDFSIPTSKTVAENTYTHDGISMTLTGTSGNGYAYYSKDKYLLNGKQGATITFSAFEWKTTKIVVTGRSGASGSTKMNIFVGENAVSTETTGSTGTNTYNIASTSQAAGTIYTLKVTSAHNAQFTKFEIYGEDAGTPAKTLTSIAVSGTPTKTSYYAGDNFDPAGLTVTGTYSDESTAPITSGITWSYDPSQELALNQTSIGVIATVSEIASPKFNVTGLTVTEGPDVFIDLLDEGWNLPTSKVVAENSYTNGGITIKLAGSTGNGYRVYTGTNILLGKQNAYLELPAFESPIEKIVVAGNSGGSANVTWNIFKGDVAVSTAVTGCKNEAYTFNIEPMEANVVYRLKVTNDNNLQIKNIKIYFGEAPAVVKPSISGETPFLNSTNVSISIPEGTTVYYTTDGSNPKTAGTQYSAALDLNNSATVKAIATDGVNWSEVAEKAFVKGTVLSVTEARAAIDAAPAGTENQFVKGIISQIDSYNSTYKSITYWISEDGTATNKLQVYSGLAGVVKEAFESTADLNVGDSVVVKGTIKKYNSTYEFDKNNTVAYRLPIARLAWSAESYAADIDNQQSNVYPTLMNTDNVAISYSSTDGSVATINGEGEISLVAVGTTTIKATFVGSDSYRWNYASYTLNVGSSLVHATISFDVDGGDAIEPLTDKQAVVLEELPVATKAGKNFGGWFKDQEKNDPVVAEALTGDITLYAKWLDPYTVAEAKTVIDANPSGIENQYVAGIISQIDSYNNTYHSITYWISADGTTTNQLQVYGGLIGNAATALEKEQFSAKEDLQLGDEVVVFGTLKLHNSSVYEFDKNNTIYTFSRKASAGLEYAEKAINKVVGDDDFINPLTNPNSVAVTYATSDDQVAEVANDGTVTIIGEGSATITASFAGNDQYKAAQVSYTLTVDAAPAPLSPYATVYTSNVAFVGGGSSYEASSKVIIANTEYDAQKVGASSKTGTVTVTVPAKTHTLHFHVFTWKNKTNVISISGVTNPSATTFDVIGDDGGGASSPYTIAGNPIDHYYSVTFDDVAEETEITFSYNSGEDKRFIMYGINQEGGVLPVLDHIVITGTATALEYETGDVFSPVGLGVDAYYTLDNQPVAEPTHLDVDENWSGWSFNPAILTESTTVTVTATYEGKQDTKDVAVTVTAPATPEILVNPASIDFGTVYQNAIVDAQGISVTLKAVDAATVTLEGDGFSIDKAALSELNSTIIVTPATTVAGTFAATVTISDNAGVAADVVINLSMKVEAVEDLSGTWIKATSIAAGDRIIIGATVSAETKTMGKQNSNNRAAVATSYFNEFGELIPGEGTKTFLVVDAGDSKFALQALNGKYLTSATSGTGNNLLEAANYENDNAKWTITIDGEGVASVVAAAGSRTYMKYNNGSTLFSCYQYATSQSPINIYKQGTPASSEVRTDLTAGNYYTICYPKAMKDVQGATLWSFIGKDANMAYIQQETAATIEAGKPYLLYAETETVTAIIGKDAAASAGSNGALHGTFELMNQDALDAAGDNIYLIIGNELRRVDGQTGNTLPANRAYIDLDQIGSAPALMPAHVRSMPLHKDTATGLENAEASEAPIKMIIDGQLYILRGEKMYNANGQLVK